MHCWCCWVCFSLQRGERREREKSSLYAWCCLLSPVATSSDNVALCYRQYPGNLRGGVDVPCSSASSHTTLDLKHPCSRSFEVFSKLSLNMSNQRKPQQHSNDPHHPPPKTQRASGSNTNPAYHPNLPALPLHPRLHQHIPTQNPLRDRRRASTSTPATFIPCDTSNPDLNLRPEPHTHDPPNQPRRHPLHHSPIALTNRDSTHHLHQPSN